MIANAVFLYSVLVQDRLFLVRSDKKEGFCEVFVNKLAIWKVFRIIFLIKEKFSGLHKKREREKSLSCKFLVVHIKSVKTYKKLKCSKKKKKTSVN